MTVMTAMTAMTVMNAPTVTPRHPTLYPVSRQSRRRLLDMLESAAPTTYKQAAKLCGLSEKTLRALRRELVAEGILLPNTASGREGYGRCPLVPVRYAALPVLEISRSRLLLRWGDTRLESVFAVVRERCGYATYEEELAWLGDRAERILGAGLPALGTRARLVQPTLLFGRGEMTPRLQGAAESFLGRFGGAASCPALTVTETVAEELLHHPATQEATLVLHICLDPTPTVGCFVRSAPGNAFLSLPHSEAMEESLGRHLRRYRVSADPAQGLSAFLREICPGLSPDCVILESPFPEQAVAACIPYLPRHTVFCPVFTDLNTPTLAHKGALRRARRMLWERMGER